MKYRQYGGKQIVKDDIEIMYDPNDLMNCYVYDDLKDARESGFFCVQARAL